jgi:hypothetical protein
MSTNTFIKMVVALAFALAVCSCIFDTRDDEPPDTGGGGCAATSLDVPTAVFTAMTCAIEDQQDAAYERVISQNFVFSPTQQDSLDQTFDGTMVYNGWNKEVEMSVLGLMLSDAQELDVDFGSPTALINDNTFVRFRVEYRLNIINFATPTDTNRYAGVAQFDVRNEAGNWRLTFWDEVENDANLTSWGFLKGILRLRLNP